jgi:ribonuclease Z
MFGVTILGNNSAIPAFDRHPTAQVVTLKEQVFLIDCGEGTQLQIAKYRIKRNKINHVFISHLHGDHYFGLIGLLTSMSLLGRTNDLHLYAPKGLNELIDFQLKLADTNLSFKIHFKELVKDEILIENNKFLIECFAVKHRIPCWGFIFREKKVPRKLVKEKLLEYEIPSAYYENLKNGKDYINKNGDIINNETLTIPNSLPKSYAYCADTIYHDSIAEQVKNCNTIYHETTYLKDLENHAAQRFHSTTHQAATIALKANIEKLIIGHFSSKYENLDNFLIETKEIFNNSFLGIEGVTFRV